MIGYDKSKLFTSFLLIPSIYFNYMSYLIQYFQLILLSSFLL